MPDARPGRSCRWRRQRSRRLGCRRAASRPGAWGCRRGRRGRRAGSRGCRRRCCRRRRQTGPPAASRPGPRACASGGEPARPGWGQRAAGNPAGMDLPQLCPLAGAQRWPGSRTAARRAASLLPGRSAQPALDGSPPARPGSAGSARWPRPSGPGGSGGWPQPSPPSGVRSWRCPFWCCLLCCWQDGSYVAGPAVRAAVVITVTEAYAVRGASAAFTAVGARKAPSTSTEAIVARASWGETSSAMLASPSTRIWIICPASRISSRSRRV